jgi:RecJ-like exonuclease
MSGYFSNMSNLPPGVSVNDPNAPWNQDDPEGVDCDVCEGTGENEDGSECENCNGEGFIEDDHDGEYDLSDEKHEAANDK